MAYIRKRKGSWQSVVRLVGYPTLTQSFSLKNDAVSWGNLNFNSFELYPFISLVINLNEWSLVSSVD